jgi:hypothetical protein
MLLKSQHQVAFMLALLGCVSALAPYSHNRQSPHFDYALAMSSNVVSRRSWIGSCGIATAFKLGLPQEAKAAGGNFVTYKDETCGFSIDVPAGWEQTEQSLPDRRKIVLFVDPSKPEENTLLFVAYTPLRDDFTSISSFGTVDQVCARLKCS